MPSLFILKLIYQSHSQTAKFINSKKVGEGVKQRLLLYIYTEDIKQLKKDDFRNSIVSYSHPVGLDTTNWISKVKIK